MDAPNCPLYAFHRLAMKLMVMPLLTFSVAIVSTAAGVIQSATSTFGKGPLGGLISVVGACVFFTIYAVVALLFMPLWGFVLPGQSRIEIDEHSGCAEIAVTWLLYVPLGTYFSIQVATALVHMAM